MNTPTPQHDVTFAVGSGRTGRPQHTPAPPHALVRLLSSPAGGPILSAASQGVGLLQILLLTRGTQAGVATDAYFFLFGLALLPAQVLVDGILYPALLNRWINAGPIDRFIRLVAPALAAAAVVGGAIWLSANDRLPASLVAMSIVLALNGAATLRIWRHAVNRSAAGSPLWLAGMMLPANLVACAALLPPWADATTRATAMVVGLLVGNAVNLVLAARQGRRSPGPKRSTTPDAALTSELPAQPSPDADPVVAGAPVREGGWWYLARPIAGYGTVTAVQAAAAILPASSITIMSILYRVVASGSATFVNAVSPRFIHAETTDLGPGLRFARNTFRVTAAAIALTLVVFAATGADDYARYAVLATLWLMPAATGAAIQRIAFLVLPMDGVSKWAIGSSVVVVAVVGVVSGLGELTIAVLVLAGAANDLLPALYALVKIGERRFAGLLLAAVSGGSALLWVLS